MKPLLLLVVLVSSARSWPPDEVIGDMRDSSTVVQIRISPKSAFNLADMRKEAEQFLRSDGAGHHTAVLSLYADRSVAAEEGGESCEGEYRQWKVYYDGFPKGPLLVADVISIGKDAVLRLRTRKGAIIRHVMSGKDPTLISVDGIQFEMLSMAGRFRTRFEGCGVPGAIDPILLLKTNATLTEEICQRATSALAASLGSKYVWAEFRNDHWFLCEKYGIQYPFLPLGPPPSEAEYYALPQYACSIFCEGVPRCIGPTLTPSFRRR